MHLNRHKIKSQTHMGTVVSVWFSFFFFCLVECVHGAYHTRKHTNKQPNPLRKCNFHFWGEIMLELFASSAINHRYSIRFAYICGIVRLIWQLIFVLYSDFDNHVIYVYMNWPWILKQPCTASHCRRLVLCFSAFWYCTNSADQHHDRFPKNHSNATFIFRVSLLLFAFLRLN